MAEKIAKQSPVAIRLTSSRATASRGAENQKKERQSSGGDGEMCFGDEWLDDWEDEAILHQAMDDLDQSLKSNSTSVSDDAKSFSQSNDKTENNSGEALRKICSCSCEKSVSVTDSVSAEELNEKAVEVSAVKEMVKNGDCKENVCHNCQRTIEKRTESDIATNASPTKKAKLDLDLEEETKKFTMDPLRQFKGKYLWVSDLTAQAWCERQLLYDFTGMEIEGKPVEILETEAMKVGTKMHLKRG